MEEIKEKAIELLLDIISKEDFETILYEKVKTEDLIKNRLLFDLVNINYREDNFKLYLSELLDANLPKETITIYKINYYSTLIEDEEDLSKIYGNFESIYKLFNYDTDYSLLWDFQYINSRLDLVEIGYEKEDDVIYNLKFLCKKVCEEFVLLKTIEDKVKFLCDGFGNGILLESKKIKSTQNKSKLNLPLIKKWWQFWK